MDNFWSMNGYGIYIWSSYGAAFIILTFLTLYLWARLRQFESKESSEA